jgi:hypothetical protein
VHFQAEKEKKVSLAFLIRMHGIVTLTTKDHIEVRDGGGEATEMERMKKRRMGGAYLATSSPIPLVAPVTMQVKSGRWGRGRRAGR